jgi:hypothetical protein
MVLRGDGSGGLEPLRANWLFLLDEGLPVS